MLLLQLVIVLAKESWDLVGMFYCFLKNSRHKQYPKGQNQGNDLQRDALILKGR